VALRRPEDYTRPVKVEHLQQAIGYLAEGFAVHPKYLSALGELIQHGYARLGSRRRTA
jgi:hypothetical protein